MLAQRIVDTKEVLKGVKVAAARLESHLGRVLTSREGDAAGLACHYHKLFDDYGKVAVAFASYDLLGESAAGAKRAHGGVFDFKFSFDCVFDAHKRIVGIQCDLHDYAVALIYVAVAAIEGGLGKYGHLAAVFGVFLVGSGKSGAHRHHEADYYAKYIFHGRSLGCYSDCIIV